MDSQIIIRLDWYFFGYKQGYGLDYKETFASMAKITTMELSYHS